MLGVSPDELLDVLDSVDFLSTVRMRIEGDDVQLVVEGRESVLSAAASLKAKWVERVKREDEDDSDDDHFATAYNIDFLKDGMSCIEGDVEIILREPMKAGLFRCDGFSYLLMPIRL